MSNNKSNDEVAKNLKPSGVRRRLGKKSKKQTNSWNQSSSAGKTTKKSPKNDQRESPVPNDDDDANDCDPADVQLLDYAQWQAEKGCWIGEYTFLQGDGNPFVSGSWNYPYDHYKGFITGEVVG